MSAPPRNLRRSYDKRRETVGIRPNRSGTIGRTPLLVAVIAFWVTMGAGVIEAATSQNPAYLVSDIPDLVRACVWLIPAAFAVVTLITYRWGPLAVCLLWIGPALRAVNYWAAEGAWLITDGASGVENSWYLGCLYTSMLLFVAATAILTRNDRAVREGII